MVLENAKSTWSRGRTLTGAAIRKTGQLFFSAYFALQLRQLGDVHRDPPRLIFAEALMLAAERHRPVADRKLRLAVRRIIGRWCYD
jgi:hypothetical protein